MSQSDDEEDSGLEESAARVKRNSVTPSKADPRVEIVKRIINSRMSWFQEDGNDNARAFLSALDAAQSQPPAASEDAWEITEEDFNAARQEAPNGFSFSHDIGIIRDRLRARVEGKP